jgi:ankyrin repeat protein
VLRTPPYRAGLKLLLDLPDFDVNNPFPDGETALRMAIRRGHREAVEMLLASDADPNESRTSSSPVSILTGFGLAVFHDQVDIVRLLLNSGKVGGNIKHAPLPIIVLATLYGSVELVKVLLDSKLFDPNERDSNWSPIHYAIRGVASLAADNMFGRVFTTDGIRDREPKIKALLTSPRINANILGGRLETTPLLTAIHWDNQYALSLLLASGKADVNRVYNMDGTPLIFAIKTLKVEMVKLLLEQGGADPNKEFQELKPLDYARGWDLSLLLEKHGAYRNKSSDNIPTVVID